MLSVTLYFCQKCIKATGGNCPVCNFREFHATPWSRAAPFCENYLGVHNVHSMLPGV